MSIEIIGLDKIKRSFNDFKFIGPLVTERFLIMIGQETVNLLKLNTPIDTGSLANSWRIMSIGQDYVDVGTDQMDILTYLTQGTKPHIIRPKNKSVLRFEIGGEEIFTTLVNHPGTKRNNFLDAIGKQVNNIIIARLEQSLSEHHEYFRGLPGGKGKRFQQVGRTSAGFSGGVSFAGRSTLQRPGFGTKRLKPRIGLRRRRGRSINPSRKNVKLG